jgi:predicted RNA-binding Zn-ribbon protein involved in translation (DUF1610 family)
MATIRATCTECGDVQLTTADVTVRMCTTTEQGEYRFQCPACETVVVRSAEPRTIDLLLAAGVAYTTWSLPQELFEHHYGAPLTHDDLIDFHAWLADDDQVAQALASIS